ncbi:monocarboxylate transporter 9-like [Littorina saxatilis]|uniref:monocarboxylate transporter 9-like n=1 Tax=Littorina saxatilis TaxID=31220 RepID=UPI0038B5508C
MQTDRGWAWVVLAASMGGNLLTGVLCYFVGVIHTGLLHQFHASVTTTAWVGALYSSNMCLTAPLASVIINRYGCRVCCALGGFLCFAGFTASAFVTSMPMLFVTYGIIAGLGLGLCYSPTLITIGFYFDKFRGLASGVSVCFAAIGILSGSLVAQFLIEEYTVSGAFLLIGAVSFHYTFFAMFFRPTSYELNEMKVKDTDCDTDNEWETRASRISLALHGVEIISTSLHSIHKNDECIYSRPGYGSVTSLLRRAQLNRRKQSLENCSLDASMQSGEVFSRNHSTSLSVLARNGDIPGHTQRRDFTMTDRTDKARTSNGTLCSGTKGLDNSCDTSSKTPGIVISLSDQNGLGDRSSVKEKVHGSKETVNGVLPESAEGHVASETPNDVTDPNDDTSSHLLPQIRISTDCDDVHSVTSHEMTKSFPRQTKSSEKSKLKMLKAVDRYLIVVTNKAFMFHCAGVLAANVHISGVYLHLPEYVGTNGTSPTEAAALFVAVGVMSLLSRLATGFATTEPKIDPLTLHMGMVGLCGLFTILFPYYADTYSGQLVFSGLFGLYTGGQYALVSVLTVHFTELSLLPTALGVMVFFMGVGYVIGPPLAALIVDSGGTYQHSFIFLGCMMLLGSFLDMAAGFFYASRDQEDDIEIVSVNRDWLGSSLVISIQETGSAHVQYDAGSMMSVRSRHSQDLKV